MANCYLVCAFYLISLQGAVMAGGYTKEGPAPTNGEKAVVTTDPQAGSSVDKDTTNIEEGSAALGDIVKSSLKDNDVQYRNELSFLNAGTHNFHLEGSSPYSIPYHGNPSAYPGHSYYTGSPSGYPIPSSVYPGFAGFNTPPIPTDYVSRYQGPGTVPVVLPDGTLADTPEVIAARAAHLNALHRAQALWYGPKDDGSYNPVKYGGVGGYPTPGSTGPSASRPAGHESAGQIGPLATGYQNPLVPEYQDYLAPGYAGASVTGNQWPLASPTVLPSGYLADTSEVVAAKLAHLTAVVRANEQHAALWRTNNQNGWK